jgi:hypothetical protein
MSTVSGLLETLLQLSNKIDHTSLGSIRNEIDDLNTAVGNLQENLNNNFITKNTYNTDLGIINDSIVWHNIKEF